MKILVVGGAGMIGGHAALHLQSLGHDVTISGRNPPQATTQLARLPYLRGDYVNNTFTKDQLAAFDAVVFAAGADIRHIPEGADYGDFTLKANGEAVPAFAKLAKEAGVKRFVHIGSFYPHVAPELMEKDKYIRSRKLAADGVNALADKNFITCSLDAPFVVGTVPGMSLPMFEAYTAYAEGKLGMPAFGPAGGTNFISCQSLSEAIAGALLRMESGKSYLVGDENLPFATYFGMFFKAAGNDVEVPSKEENHPMLPDNAIFTGRGNFVKYEPDPASVALLGYRRNDIQRAVNEIVAQFGSKRTGDTPAEIALTHAYRRIASIYAKAMDQDGAALLPEIMTNDIIVEGPGFKMDGLAQSQQSPVMLKDMYEKTQHVVHNQTCELTGQGTATGETYCTAHHIIREKDGQGPTAYTWHIRYQDRLVMENGKWMLQYRLLVLDWTVMTPVKIGPQH